MWKNAYDTYLEDRTLSADPLELVRLLYDAALGAVREARRCLAAGEIAARSRAISKASAVVIELNAALDDARGGEISRRLAALYDYILRRLLEANLQRSDAALAEVLSLLATLADGWNGTRRPAEATGVPAPWSVPGELAGAGASQVWNV